MVSRPRNSTFECCNTNLATGIFRNSEGNSLRARIEGNYHLPFCRARHIDLLQAGPGEITLRWLQPFRSADAHTHYRLHRKYKWNSKIQLEETKTKSENKIALEWIKQTNIVSGHAHKLIDVKAFVIVLGNKASESTVYDAFKRKSLNRIRTVQLKT